MAYDERFHHRRSIRLRGYDYSSPGVYFVTICLQDNRHLFGHITNGTMHLTLAGRMADEYWRRLSDRFPTIRLDAHIIMPNHMHGLIIIPHPARASLVDALPADALPADGEGTRPAPTAAGAGTLGDIVGAYKSLTTNAYIRGVRADGWPRFRKRLWHRDYYERIVRSRRELDHVRRYIVDNPCRWHRERNRR